ncbi:MAG: hypothetical protein JWO05_1542 [Gemmatimonadetes bacterium]|nr:hypothetical protein [Gemmatimonadota bacterium]
MHSAGAAFAFEFRRRHGWGLLALCAYLSLLALTKLYVVTLGAPIHLDSPESFAFVIVVPLTATFTFFLAVFTFGLSGDMAARQSMYPARLFALPLSTDALVGWPMLLGSAAMILLWIATRLFALWPSGIPVPLAWPAVLAAGLLSWTQALTWMPYALRGMRVFVIVFWLAAIDAIVMLALYAKATEPVMLAIVAPLVPLAWLCARAAVTRARCGYVPDWSGALGPTQVHGAALTKAGGFRSPARAQLWFEWKRFGRSLPVLTGILLPVELLLLFAAGTSAALVFAILLGVLVTPPIVATFVAAAARRGDAPGADAHGLPPFTATRPLSSAGLVGATLQAAAWSTVAAWALVVVAIPVGLSLSRTWPVVVERLQHMAGLFGTTRVLVALLLLVVAMIASTWKQVVQSVYIGFTGRDRLVKGSVFVTLVAVAFLGPALQWVAEHRRAQGAIWEALPLVLAVLASLKMGAASWVAVRLQRSGLVSDWMLVTGAACWCVAVLALYALLAWFIGTPFFPHHVLMLVAILWVPLARVSAAPLALAWNRHR